MSAAVVIGASTLPLFEQISSDNKLIFFLLFPANRHRHFLHIVSLYICNLFITQFIIVWLQILHSLETD